MHFQTGFIFLLAAIVQVVNSASSCGYPGAPAHSSLTFSAPKLVPGVVATYACETGFELLGPARRVCTDEGKWTPEGIPFCVLNVAAGKAPMQSSVAGGGVPQKAVDGSAASFFNPATCTLTQPERAPWWYVNLLEPYMVQLVRLDFGRPCCGDGQVANIVVRVGNNRPDLGVNPVCNKFTGVIEEGKPLFLPCNPPIAGAFVSVQLEGPPGNSLSICEAFVYTDQALPMERCPQFRDQPPGSTATYNGKCYIFYSQQTLRFDEARQFCASRGGSLVDDSNPALQGFLSWEMWRRHRSDPSAQYWLGAVRDTKDLNNWKWLNGRDVTVSFWNLPGGRGNCARFDGAKGWLWSDTNCNDQLNFICQHGPRGCGRPEQPPNSTLLATSLDVGARIEHRCDPGHLLVGPAMRTCLPNGFYSEFPPICRYLECGPPAQVPNGHYSLINGTRGYQSMVRYSCDDGHVMVGRSDLMCDIDKRWDGPPPRCEPLVCPDPPQILHGHYSVEAETTDNTYIVHYECDARFTLVGPNTLICSEGVYDQPPPVCREASGVVSTSSKKSTSSSSSSSSVAGGPPSSTRTTSPPVTTYRSTNPLNKQPNSHSQYGHASETTDGVAAVVTNTDDDRYNGGNGHSGEPSPYDEDHYTDADLGGTHLGGGDGNTVGNGGSFNPNIHSIIHGNNNEEGDHDKEHGVGEAVPSLPDETHGGDIEDPLIHNEVAEESVNSIVRNAKPPLNELPKSVEAKTKSEDSAVARLNLSGIIALGVFAGIIVLAAIVLSIVLLIRRSQVKGKHDRHRNSPDSHTITSVDSGSDAGLGRLYRRAWDSLAASGGPPTASTTVTTDKSRRTKDTLDFRSRLSSVEGMRGDGEIIVHDALPRKHHHHHHHGIHHHHNNMNDSASTTEWGRSVRSHRSRY